MIKSKKTLLGIFAAACISVTNVMAQTEKGTTNLGLSIGYQHQSNDASFYDGGGLIPRETTSNAFLAGPSFSYFIKNKLELGISFAYSHQLNKVDGEDNAKIDRYSPGVFLVKHLMFSDRFGFRTGPFFSYDYSKTTSFVNDPKGEKITGQGINTGVNLGLEYFPTRRIGIAATIGNISYSHSTQKYEGSDLKHTSNDFSANLTNSLDLGIFWVFGHK